jgi:hypothetical protein
LNYEKDDIKDNKIAKDAIIMSVFLYTEDNADTIIKKFKRKDTDVCIELQRHSKPRL